MKIFSSAIALTDTPLTRPGPHGEPLPRFGEHVCRVSGAQFLSRLGYSLEAIQLIGRWGSDAVKRYIQEAPLAATPNDPCPTVHRPTRHPTASSDRTRAPLQFMVDLEPTQQHCTHPSCTRNSPEYQMAHPLWMALRTRRPSPDRLKTSAANASRKSRKMTMAHHPKTNSRDDHAIPLIQTKTDVHT